MPAANRLIRENNQVTNQTVTYEYDDFGNILNKKVYAYTTGTLGSPSSTVSYAYTNSAWGDQLTSYDGTPITYDSMGNPTTYRGYTMTWRGKQLAGFTNGTKTVSFEYNEDGLRQQKTYNGVVTDYYYNGSVLIGMQRGTAKELFSYDAAGNVVSVNHNGTEYYYLRNAQGDIIKIIDGSGATVVEYTYDTWGKKVSTTGSLAGSLGLIQPFRYRGYVYDWETGFYYLQSRYYDPTVGRFISADVLLSTGQGVLGYNCYAYCLGNPVNMVDSQGNRAVIGFDPNKNSRGRLYEEFCSNDDAFVQEIVALINEKYSYSSWTACSTDAERDTFLKNLVNDTAGIMGITVIDNVGFADHGDLTTGVYDYSTKTITFNERFHKGNSMNAYTELLKTVVHECRHAYQYQYILSHTNSLSSYIQKEFRGFGNYNNRFVEKDADAFENVVIKYLEQILSK